MKNPHPGPQANASELHTDSQDRSQPVAASPPNSDPAAPAANATNLPLPASQTASLQDPPQNNHVEPFRSPPAPSSRHRSQKTLPADSLHAPSPETPRHIESTVAGQSRDSTLLPSGPSQTSPHS